MMVLLVLWLGTGGDAAEWLDRSIRFHDPDGAWSTFAATLEMRETRPGGEVRAVSVTLDRPGERFVYEAQIGEHHIVRRLEGAETHTSLNGRTDLSDEELERFRLSPDRVAWYRNYYLYLWGLPQKLRDPGTNLADTVTAGRFLDREVMVLSVTYAPEVGTDYWEFYLDPDSAELVGCRFWREDRASDGEYIVFEGLYRIGNMRIPAKRAWYTNADDRLLGTDALIGHGPAE